MKLVLLASLLLTGCAKALPPRLTRRVDPRLEPYVRVFERAYGVQASYSVVLADLPDSIEAGECQPGFGVRIDRAFFEANSQYGVEYLEQTVIHEMGHCSFGLGHTDVQYQHQGPYFGCPMSVMSTYTTSKDCWNGLREHYLEELGIEAGKPVLEVLAMDEGVVQ